MIWRRFFCCREGISLLFFHCAKNIIKFRERRKRGGEKNGPGQQNMIDDRMSFSFPNLKGTKTSKGIYVLFSGVQPRNYQTDRIRLYRRPFPFIATVNKRTSSLDNDHFSKFIHTKKWWWRWEKLRMIQMEISCKTKSKK